MENIWCVSINCYHKLSTILENGFLNWGLRLSRSRDLHLHYNDFGKCWMRNSNFLWGFHWKHTINNCIVNANHIVHSKLTIKCYENKSIRNLCFGTWEFPSIRSLCIFSNAPENGTRTPPAKTFPIFALITFSWENTRKKHWNKKHKFPLHFSCTKKLVSKTIKFCGFSIIFINDVQH